MGGVAGSISDVEKQLQEQRDLHLEFEKRKVSLKQYKMRAVLGSQICIGRCCVEEQTVRPFRLNTRIGSILSAFC